MPQKNKKTHDFKEKILVYALSDLVSDRFSRYARYVLIDRAIPDVRDGLKPVQRRILYAMADLGLFAEQAFKKSARVIGEVIGKYHPHGDASVYAAMIRMAQPWKYNMPLIDMQGNKGSIDGDSAAAMRYTEAKLSPISQLLLSDLKKDTVNFADNFDETEKEPLILTSYFPNLLVNGTTGIAVGLATNIPPHNLNEVLDAVIYRINHPEATLSEIMKAAIKGPDFPTGGIIQGLSGIRDAYKHGKGRIIIRAKTTKEVRTKKPYDQLLVITEIPYEVVKQDLVRKLEEARLAKNAVAGIKEIRDETDRTGLRIVVELTAEANYDQVLNYLLKNTNLQISYNLNLVAIADKKPKVLSLLELLDYYLKHQIQVYTRKSKFELHQFQQRLEIINGLIIALEAIDKIISTIRKSNNRVEAKINLINQFNLTDLQAEAIVQLRLYRLSATDVKELINEKAELKNKIKFLQQLLDNKSILLEAIANNLTAVKNNFFQKRRSIIAGEISEIKIDEKASLKPVDLFITISFDGWIKTINSKILDSNPDYNEFGRKPNDIIISQGLISNLSNLLVITNKGNYIIIPGYKLIENKWKDIGTHLNTLCKVDNSEKIITVASFTKTLAKEQYLLLVTKNGFIKRVSLTNLIVDRYNKASKCIALSNNDQVVAASFTNNEKWILVTANNSFTVKFLETNISVLGLTAKGIKAIKLAKDNFVVGASVGDSSSIYNICTDIGGIKRISFNSIMQTNRATKGNKLINMPKNKNFKVTSCFTASNNEAFNLLTNNEKWRFFAHLNNLPITRADEGFPKVIVDSITYASNIHLWKFNN